MTANNDVHADSATLIVQHVQLLDRLVRETLDRVPSCVDRDELATAGLIALVTAAEAFDAGHGVPFGEYAATRIRRALAAELRGMDWSSCSPDEVDHIERLACLGAAIAELPEVLRMVCEQYFLAERPTAEIAEALGVTESQVSRMCTEGLVLLRDTLAPVAVCA